MMKKFCDALIEIVMILGTFAFLVFCVYGIKQSGVREAQRTQEEAKSKSQAEQRVDAFMRSGVTVQYEGHQWKVFSQPYHYGFVPVHDPNCLICQAKNDEETER